MIIFIRGYFRDWMDMLNLAMLMTLNSDLNCLTAMAFDVQHVTISFELLGFIVECRHFMVPKHKHTITNQKQMTNWHCSVRSPVVIKSDSEIDKM